MTKLVMISSPGYPVNLENLSTLMPRMIGIITFLIGINSLIFVTSLSGWMHSKRLGIATTIIGIAGIVFFSRCDARQKILDSLSTIFNKLNREYL